jgi:D-alanyl-D-alanine-carboxypeptidase/D-alanyl-D-alanine-endopeptidase
VSELADIAARFAPKPPAGIVVARARSDAPIEVAVSGPVEADGVFELGSVTKAVTGLLLADAVVRGEVALETTLDEVFDGARPLRLVDLATHTAGLPRLPLAMLRRAGFTNMTDPYAGTTVDQLLGDLAKVRVRRRGRRRYSNFGAALLGQALAARAGAPYEELVHCRILAPLGVTEVWAIGAPPVVQPHDKKGRPVPPWDLGAYAAAGSLRGTARGVLSLATACLSPPAPMADAVALALQPHARGRMLEPGLGWLRSPAGREHRMWWHSGGTHGSRSFVALVPETGAAAVALTNSPKSVDRAGQTALI